MPNPTAAADWAEKCNQDYLTSMHVEGRSNGHLRHGLCLSCADAYARQQVEERDVEWNRGLDHIRRELGDFPDAIVPGTVKGMLSVWVYRSTRQQVEAEETP